MKNAKKEQLLKYFGVKSISSGSYGEGFLEALLLARKKIIRLDSTIRKHEGWIKSLEMKATHVPCSIEGGEGLFICEEPFCKFVHFSHEAEKAKREWITKLREELKGVPVKEAKR